MSDETERFLSRWSRLKTRARDVPPDAVQAPAAVPAAPPAAGDDAPAPLQPVEELTPESDFKPFMDPRVDASTRRAALKRLFADARFNVPDPFEAYSEDYTANETIPMELLKTLNQARKIVFDEAEPAPQAAADAPQDATADPTDVARRQDA